MALLEFDVIQPPTAGELEAELRALPQLGFAALKLTVVRKGDELAARRNGMATEIVYDFSVDSTSQGGTPYILGHLVDTPTINGRLEIVSDGTIPDENRPLHLTLFDPSF